MIIDHETFTDLGMTLKAQADVLLLMAKLLAQEPESASILRHYVSEMNNHLTTMESILRAVREENHAAATSGNTGRA